MKTHEPGQRDPTFKKPKVEEKLASSENEDKFPHPQDPSKEFWEAQIVELVEKLKTGTHEIEKKDLGIL